LIGFRSTTPVRLPSLTVFRAINLPAVPLPITRNHICTHGIHILGG
jgi:hypothetical protein